MPQTLTVSERILYHLYQYIKSEDKYEAPFDVTQDGIAQSCGISRAHAAIELKKLKDTNQIEERLSHVRRAKSRRKVYFLTSDGKSKASKIVDYVRTERVDTGVDSSRIAQGSGPAKRPKRYISAVPQVKQFFGRKEEFADIRKFIDDDSVEIINLIGLSGIGKTTLLARFAKESKASVFWFSLNEWETEISLLRSLSNFLEETGDDRLSNYLRSDGMDLGEISYLLSEALSENRRILIFDDIDKSPRLEKILKMVIMNAGPNKIILTSEKHPSIVDEVQSQPNRVKDILIGGLLKDAAEELLRSRGIDMEKIDSLCELTGNHPLMLEMIPADDELSAKMEMTNFVRKILLKDLNSSDMKAIERCSILRKPFLQTYLIKDERQILQLPIFYSISGTYKLHEMVRRIIENQISEKEKRELHSRAADYFLAEKNAPERLFHLIHAGRHIEAEMLIQNRSDELLDSESPRNLLDLIELIPPRVSKYAPSIKILNARASSLIGDEKGSIDRLIKISEDDDDEGRISALIELANKRLDRRMKNRVTTALTKMLDEGKISKNHSSKIALSLATMKLREEELKASEEFALKGLSMASHTFSVDTISSLNRVLGQILVQNKKYQESINFLSKTAPSFTGQYQPLYNRLLSRSIGGAGDLESAKTVIEDGIEIAERNGLFKEMAESLLDLSEIKSSLEDLDGAAESCYRCIEVSSSLEEKTLLKSAYSKLAQIESKRGNIEEAKEKEEIAKKL